MYLGSMQQYIDSVYTSFNIFKKPRMPPGARSAPGGILGFLHLNEIGLATIYTDPGAVLGSYIQFGAY